MSASGVVPLRESYDMAGRVAFITGGGGLLGPMHGLAIAESGGVPVLADIDEDLAAERAESIRRETASEVHHVRCDVTSSESVREALDRISSDVGAIEILVNNAANDPKVSADEGADSLMRLENLPLDRWEADLAVGLTGAFLCAQLAGTDMARRGRGVILNITSDLGIIAPDQRLYRVPGRPDDAQPVKPVTYSVIKHGIIGLTKYLSTYWADRGVRVNALAPGGVFQGQPAAFLDKVHDRIPMARLARADEYRGAVAFLCSDASSYITGTVLVADGGRSVW